MKNAFIGRSADKASTLEVDAVSGATYSSEGIISNVKRGLDYYLESEN